MLLHVSGEFDDPLMVSINLPSHGGIRSSYEVLDINVTNHAIPEDFMEDQHRNSLECQQWNTCTTLGGRLISFRTFD